MGTRADFYSQTSAGLEWLGSIAWDGYPEGIPARVFDVKTDEEWRERVAKFIGGRDDGTKPEQGWPWPWEDSRTSDYAYCFVGKIACFAATEGDGGLRKGVWVAVDDHEDYWNWRDATDMKPQPKFHGGINYPNMKDKMRVTMGDRSGLLVIRASE